MLFENVQAVRDFLDSIKGSLGLDVYSFSVFHVFFEQYLSIGRDAAVLLVAAAVAVTLVTLLFTASVWASVLVLLVLCMILVRGLPPSAILHASVSVTAHLKHCSQCSVCCSGMAPQHGHSFPMKI